MSRSLQRALERVVTTTARPNYLAHLALVGKIHANGLLKYELLNLLKGSSHDIAATFVNDKMVCVMVLTEYGQLMGFTVPAFRKKGLGRKTARLLARRTGVSFKLMLGGVGKNAKQSRGFFEALGVELSDDYN